MLSYFFSREEFACKCGCGYDTVDAELLKVLEDIRKHFNSPILISSATRCPEHNLNVGGSPTSQHLLGRAADIVVKNTPAKDVYIYLKNKYKGKYGIGSYSNFTHIDTRGSESRWYL